MSDPVILQVGERRFQTTIDVLVEKSRYFKALFSGQWAVKKQPDDSIFIDRDGKAFEHVLQYIRGGVFPVMFDKESGQHDYILYNTILEEAKYFQCDNLVIFLEDECYLRCVNWRTTYQIHNFESFIDFDNCGTTPSQFCSFRQFERKVYVCPRGIPAHRGNQYGCGRRCKNALGDIDPEYAAVTVSRLLVEEKKFKYHYGWMNEHGTEFSEYLEKKKET
ncbi:hypothetical protein FQN53_002094 [Emmonsiellopsis sp. PD_33]|nr:hypothetical protein FQN53_002094 [Emmonsiellopsis sp. PD_33]